MPTNKGNKWQQVPISYDGFKPLHEYLVKHRPVLATLDGRTATRKEDAVFLSDNGKAINCSGHLAFVQGVEAKDRDR